MEKPSILNRRASFWWVQFVGVSLIFLTTRVFNFSILSVVCGIVFSYAQMHILLLLFRGLSFKKSIFLLFVLKNVVLLGGVYFMLSFLDGFSFLLGLTSLLVFIVGLSVEVYRHGSL